MKPKHKILLGTIILILAIMTGFSSGWILDRFTPPEKVAVSIPAPKQTCYTMFTVVSPNGQSEWRGPDDYNPWKTNDDFGETLMVKEVCK